MTTPSSTRTYLSKEQILFREHLNLDRRIEKLNPTPAEMEAIHHAAVAFFAYNASRGRRSPFPSPFDFIDDFMGVDPDAPALPREQSKRGTIMLKLAYHLYHELKSQVDSDCTQAVSIRCPACEKKTMICHIGTGFKLGSNSKITVSQNPRLVALYKKCICQGVGTVQLKQFEREALAELV